MNLSYKIIYTIILILLIIPKAQAVEDDSYNDKPKKKKIYLSLELLSLNVKDVSDDESFSLSNSPALKWYPLMRQVRDSRISRQQAVDSMNAVLENISLYVKMKSPEDFDKDQWVFPIKGYTPGAIGGKRGNGYITSGFDFFEVNSGGHPAQDIFINDSNQDCIDDNTGNPVDVLSVSGGIIVETRINWTTDMMDIKGGNIVYVYDGFTDGLFYYAHLKDVFVKPGDFVKPGTALGIIGRTGKNAYPKRSPTHLHLMYVKNNKGDLKPQNLYDELLKAKLIP